MSGRVLVIGAGPAGLTAAHDLAERGVAPVVLERGSRPGGIARTEEYRGYRFDIGGHRFYTKVEEVERLWHRMLGDDFRTVRRLSRIYYKGRFFRYPLSLGNTLATLGPLESLKILASFVRARSRRGAPDDTFEDWVTNRFGRRLYETFFKSYTEKVWGIPCAAIEADWAAQRIKGLTLSSAVRNALWPRGNGVRSLIEEFHYPLLGPGMMWERFTDEIGRLGGRVHFGADVLRVRRDGTRITSVAARRQGETTEHPAEHFISTMAVDDLVMRIDPPPPFEVIAAAKALRHRAFILVGLILRRPEVFADQWVYVHAPEVRAGRIQNFKSWSPQMVPDPATTSLGVEYFCSEGDDLWSMTDSELLLLAARELDALGLADMRDVADGVVIRQPKAYPVYDRGYRDSLATIRAWLDGLPNLQTAGRNGMHRYNNQDHSMLTGLLAVRNIFGEGHDLWDVNTERSYYETFERTERAG